MRKSTRLSYIGLSQAREQVRSFRTRFSLTSYAKRVQQLTPEQRSAISRTGFGNLLSIPNHSLNKVLLTELMDTWSCERHTFVLRSGSEIQMTLLDVALILGLPVSGNPVALKEEEPFSDLEERYGATKGKRKVALSFLENTLDSIGDVASDDFVRSFLLYTIGTFLSSNDGKVDSRYLSFLANLGEVSQFAWGAAVVDDLCQWLDKRKEHNVQYVGGCLIFLQTWSYEHFDGARSHLQNHDLTFPRVCRWDNSKSNQRQRGASWFKDLHDDQVIWKLQPTSRELQIEIIKETLEFLDDNEELETAENYWTSTSTNGAELFHSKVPDADSGFSNEVHSESEYNYDNQVVEDTPTRLNACEEEYREQEINLKNLVVLDTPPNLTNCDTLHRQQRMNLENPVVLVEHTPTNLRVSDADEVGGEQGINLENVEMIVEDTPTNLSKGDEVSREHGMNLEHVEVVVEDTPTILSVAHEVGKEQEFNGEKLVAEDTPPILSFYDDALRKKNVMLEVENAELKMKIGLVTEENELLHKQILSNTQFKEQNADLKKELDLLREENTILRLSISRFVDRMDRHVLDFETNATE
ncbi:hypothetical protein VNO77_07281 [Canavalia gladiata]|uniref:Aminotransferase-like plant mobile domain-containing protein n=1 Tax=Canavalia gladiata TaxID=3824 RepID=A0AAN9QWJ7_CANGL